MITAQERLTPMLGASPTRAAIQRATGIDPKTGLPTLLREPSRPIFGHGAILSMRRLGDKRAAVEDFYRDVPYSPPVRVTKDRGVSARGYQHPPEQVIVRSAKYKGERGGFRTFKAVGPMRRDIIAIKRAKAAIVSVTAAPLVKDEPAPAEKKAAKPRAKKKAAAE